MAAALPLRVGLQNLPRILATALNAESL